MFSNNKELKQWRRDTVERILDFCNQEEIRVTYGAVAGVIEVLPSFVGNHLGVRSKRSSWIVREDNHKPSGYKPNQIHENLFKNPEVIKSPEILIHKVFTPKVRYISTRGKRENSPPLDFERVLLSGLAPDGGLYVPNQWPKINKIKMEQLRGASYVDTAYCIIRPFTGTTFSDETLKRLIDTAYGNIHHQAKCPLVQLGDNLFLCELFHGPTLAFKDFALQLVSRMFDHVLTRLNTTCTILGATSGDTGSSAIEAFRGLDAVDVFILYPKGKVSDIQRKQMTTPSDTNVHAIAVEGNFDDCQALVKELFGDTAFRQEFNLAAINSINWARIVAQIVYYFYSGISLGAPQKEVSFVVPTGNFGDIYAGYCAKMMGLPIKQLAIATNQNDILFRTLETGQYQLEEVIPSISPSMDIQVSSNFERVLFDAGNRNSENIVEKMQSLQGGSFDLTGNEQNYLKSHFVAGCCSEEETMEEIQNTYSSSGQVICPHTAVGVKIARELNKSSREAVISLATAHPAKFPDAVEAACGVKPVLPDVLTKKLERPERIDSIDNSAEKLKEFIRNKVRGL
ncbi:MAG: threonine synthase [Paracoccaceae bacterium]|nr:threonine synthase [Paracoccaceae bacterium]MDE2917243.1 threonine synthase [Paracoccaceae bacterium]